MHYISIQYIFCKKVEKNYIWQQVYAWGNVKSNIDLFSQFLDFWWIDRWFSLWSIHLDGMRYEWLRDDTASNDTANQ